jgi:hypothetical protein
MKKLYILSATLFVAAASQAQVVISQLYGGGGNTGATIKNDYVELFNAGTTPVSLDGYVLQYASATGNFGGSGSNPNKTYLPEGVTLQPGQYYLIKQAAGNGGTVDIEADYTPEGNQVLAMGGQNFKIALTSNDTTVTSPTDANVLDFVGVGTSNQWEGSAAAPAASNTTAVFRASNGCQDSNDNAADFTAAEPAPRNMASALNACTASVKDNNIAGLNIYPNPATGSTLYVTSYANAEKTVAIYDVLGKQVINTVTNGAVNISNLNAGVYIVKVTEEGKTASRKLVVK